ncbi:MAG: T9SS type A sorting domain-containing protein, partial [Chitinophagaceae bacterium]|nr:T9SS type A sorting domain-containing protein [Chitinophagaceae bacterium]
PNPTQGLVNIDVYATRNQLTGVKVLDMSGRVVKQILAQSEAGMNKLSIDLGDIAQGIYTIQVYENDQLTHVERVRKAE